MLKRIKITNLLSFGDPGLDLELRPLNVLIGPNGSGKSNLIDALSLLRCAPSEIDRPMRESGGITEWIHKAASGASATLDAVHVPQAGHQMPLRHLVRFRANGGRCEIQSERVETERPIGNHRDPFYYYRFDGSTAVVKVEILPSEDLDQHRWMDTRVALTDVATNASALSQYRGGVYPQLSHLSENYEKVRLFRDWHFGRSSQQRKAQSSGGRSDYLEEDGTNLGMVLKRMRLNVPVKKKVIEALRQLRSEIEDLDFQIESQTVEIVIQERDFAVPASLLSDGTIRYLWLLAILLDPEARGLVCIEEPELGLHPDLLPSLAKLMIEASGRMQLIVTTHSDIIIDALSETPESVVVCERHDGQTTMRRLVESELTDWLKDYRLGQLWTKGSIGGNRW